MFQIDHPLVKEQYQNSENYRVEQSNFGKPNVCAIYFSSHNIYYPNTPEAFTRSILQNDGYEWYQTRVPEASKHIFLRDVKKQWYLEGISSKYSSIDSVCDLLGELTHGYRTIWLGSSAGGYAATLYGNLLKGDRILSFNGQKQLSSLIQKSAPNVDPLVFKYCEDSGRSRYYSLRPHILLPEKTFYFCSIGSRWDAEQLEHIHDLGVRTIKFSSSRHGIPFLRSSLGDVVKMSSSDLVHFTREVHNPIVFSLKVSGFRKTLGGLFVSASKIIRRLFNSKLGIIR